MSASLRPQSNTAVWTLPVTFIAGLYIGGVVMTGTEHERKPIDTARLPNIRTSGPLRVGESANEASTRDSSNASGTGNTPEVPERGLDFDHEQARAFADQFYTSWIRAIDRIAPVEYRLAMFAKLKELKPEHAQHLIGLFEKASAQSNPGARDELSMSGALQLLLNCGGQEVSSFLVRTLNDSTVDHITRSSILSLLDGKTNPDSHFRKLQTTPALFDVAIRLSVSNSPKERRASCGLLSAFSSRESGSTLRTIALSDLNVHVRAAAIRGVARVCGSEGRAFLLEIIATHQGSNTEEAKLVVQVSREALAELTLSTNIDR